MWIKEILLGIIGISAGLVVAGGLFSFITSLGIVSDLADRTRTGSKVMLYEDATSVGGILGTLFFIYQIPIRLPVAIWNQVILGVFGFFAGTFVGCEIMALAEVLNLFPILIRRGRLLACVPYLIWGVAVGKGIGALIFFVLGW